MALKRTELEEAVLNAYKARYGEQIELGLPHLQYNGKIPNKTDVKGNVLDYTPYHHWQIWWEGDDGAVNEKPIYAYSPDDINFAWHDTNPTILPAKPSTEKTFTQKLQEKIKAMAGTTEYGEVIAVNDDMQKARVFIKDNATEGFYIVELDKDGNLTKKGTAFNRQ